MRAIAAISFLLGLAWSVSAPAAPSPTALTGPALGAALAAGSVDAETVDFGALRYAPGQTMAFLSAQAAAQTAIAKAHDKPNIRALTDAGVCLKPHESAALAGFNSALLAKDADDWRAEKEKAVYALDQYAEVKAAILAGAPAPYPEFAPAAEAVTRAQGSTNPQVKALFLREAGSLLWRRALLGSGPKPYAGDIGKAAKLIVNAHIEAEGCGLEAADAAWLDDALQTIPWFTIDGYGKAVDEAALDIVLHADADPALQIKVLNRLGPLALAKRTDPKAFAALWDKVALANGRPQRYGTQMRCIGKVWTPRTPLEDPGQLDQRRSWVGLPSIKTYAASAPAVCGG